MLLIVFTVTAICLLGAKVRIRIRSSESSQSVKDDLYPYGTSVTHYFWLSLLSAGPQYIDENFPLIDKFKSCSVKRVQPEQDGYAVDPFGSREVGEIAKGEDESGDDDMARDGDEGEEDTGDEDGDEEDGDEEDGDEGEDGEEESDEEEHRKMEKVDQSDQHRELHRLGGVSGIHSQLVAGSNRIPFSPTVGVVALCGVGVLAFIMKSFVMRSRKLSQKKS